MWEKFICNYLLLVVGPTKYSLQFNRPGHDCTITDINDGKEPDNFLLQLSTVVLSLHDVLPNKKP